MMMLSDNSEQLLIQHGRTSDTNVQLTYWSHLQDADARLCATSYHHCVTAQQTPDINLINNDDAI